MVIGKRRTSVIISGTWRKLSGFHVTVASNCTTIHRYPIFSTRYSVMCKVYTGYCGTSEIEHGLCACTIDNPLAKARGLSLRTGAQTMLYLSLILGQQGHTGFYKTSRDVNYNDDIRRNANRGRSASRKHCHTRTIYSRPTGRPSFVPFLSGVYFALYRGSTWWILNFGSYKCFVGLPGHVIAYMYAFLQTVLGH